MDVTLCYRWHAWFGRRVCVHDVLERRGGADVRCTVHDAPLGRSQELPLWMLDAATCEPMRDVESPVASAAALEALHALLTEALAWDAARPEGVRDGRVGSGDRHQGDRHAASVTPSAEPTARPVLPDDAAAGPGGPSWASLPETTRAALTGLVTRMLIAHAEAEPFEPEDVGDDE